MSTFELDNMLPLRNWKLLLRVGLTEMVVCMVLAALLQGDSSEYGLVIPILVLFLSLYPAFILSFAQKEFLNGTFTWNLPGLLPRFFRVQVFWLGLTALASGAFISVLGPITEGAFAGWEAAHFWSFGCLAGMAYILMSLAVFRFEYSAMFPTGVVFLILIASKESVHGGAKILPILAEFWVFSAALLFMILVLRKMVIRKSLQRALCGRPLLTPTIATSPSRMQAYNVVMDKKLGTGEFAQRLGGKMMRAVLNRVAEAKAGGHYTRSKLWAGLFLFVTTLPRGRWKFYLTIFFVPAWLLVGGYLDTWFDSSLERWFSSLSFLFFAYLPGILGYSMVEHSLVLQSRQSREKAGFQMAGWLAAASLGMAGFIWGILKLMEATLPSISAAGREIAYLAPHPEMIFSALFVLPPALVIVARFKPTRLQMQMVSMVVFYAFLLLSTLARSGYGRLPSVLVAVLWGLFLTGIILFTVLWRKRCRQWDQ